MRDHYSQAHNTLRALFDAAVKRADPAQVLAHYLPNPPKGRIVVVGAGKSAAAMARAVEHAWPDRPLSGLVVTRYGHALPTRRIEVAEAAHPVPDRAGLQATARMLGLLQGLGPDDLVLALISGGGSALLTAPRSGVTLEDKQALARALLASGLPIGQMNALRRRLSVVKGGGLARAAAPARVVTLAISDVPGDDPADIASGPTVPDPTAATDLAPLIARLDLPATLKTRLQTPSHVPMQPPSDIRLIATPMQSLQAAADAARSLGVAPLILGDALEGEATEAARVIAGIALSIRAHGHPLPAPAVLLSGGETTVTLGPDPGRGGRNTSFALALALALDATPGITALAADTDGIDGSEDAAGALIDPDTLTRARMAGLAPACFLHAQDSYSFFAQLGDLVTTGPTLTNVNDFRAVLIC